MFEVQCGDINHPGKIQSPIVKNFLGATHNQSKLPQSSGATVGNFAINFDISIRSQQE
jgi:hypothetical protein